MSEPSSPSGVPNGTPQNPKNKHLYRTPRKQPNGSPNADVNNNNNNNNNRYPLWNGSPNKMMKSPNSGQNSRRNTQNNHQNNRQIGRQNNHHNRQNNRQFHYEISLETVLSSLGAGSVFLALSNGRLVLANTSGPLFLSYNSADKHHYNSQLTFSNSGGAVALPKVVTSGQHSPASTTAGNSPTSGSTKSPSAKPAASYQKFGRFQNPPSTSKDPSTSGLTEPQEATSGSMHSQPSTSGSKMPTAQFKCSNCSKLCMNSSKITLQDCKHSFCR